jgi:hypothetical protein
MGPDVATATVLAGFRSAFACSNVRVILDPRKQNVVQIQEKIYILNLVFLHHLPGFRDAGHAIEPELKP